MHRESRSIINDHGSVHRELMSIINDHGSVHCESMSIINDHGSVHLKSMSIIVQQDATMYSLLYSCKLLYKFWVVTPPITRSTYNCNYSICHWSNFGKCSVWCQLKMRGVDPTVSATFRDLRSRKVAETVGSTPLNFSWLHTLHFPKFDQWQML